MLLHACIHTSIHTYVDVCFYCYTSTKCLAFVFLSCGRVQTHTQIHTCICMHILVYVCIYVHVCRCWVFFMTKLSLQCHIRFDCGLLLCSVQRSKTFKCSSSRHTYICTYICAYIQTNDSFLLWKFNCCLFHCYFPFDICMYVCVYQLSD